jgi:hypothetical protein
MLCLLKTSRDLQMFAAVTHIAEGLTPETLLTLKFRKVSNLLSGYTETYSIHNGTIVKFVFETIIKPRDFVAWNKAF